jgi:hypothetical protein
LSDLLSIAAGVTLLTVEFARSVPAYQRVRNHRTSDGVSGWATGVFAGSGLGWLWLAFAVQSWWVLAANIIWLAYHLALCREIWKVSPTKRKALAVSSVLGGAVTGIIPLALSFLGWSTVDVLGVILAGVTVLYLGPAIWEGLTAPTTGGLSVIALSVTTFEGLVYLLAGVGVLNLGTSDGGEWILGFVLYGILAIFGGLTRLGRVVPRRLRGLQ